MPHESCHSEVQSAESEELFQISPHCTWCAIHTIRLQQLTNRRRREPYTRGDSSSSAGGERIVMRSRGRARKSAVCDSGRETSDDESLSQMEGAAQCGKCGPDVGGKCSHARNTCLCYSTEGKAKATGRNEKCARCPSPGAESPKMCDSKCDHALETVAGTGKNVRQIVTESRCPCLCAYLHFTDTVDACTCVERSPSCPTPDRDSKTPADAPDIRTTPPPAPSDKKRFCCCVARCFSAFRKHSKRSTPDASSLQPSPAPLEQKNSAPSGDGEIAKDTCCCKDVELCARCQNCCRKGEMSKSDITSKPSKGNSFLSAGIQRHTEVGTAPRASAEVMGRDSCFKYRRTYCGSDDAEDAPSGMRCACDCESRNKDLKKFRSSLQRICRALSGCNRSRCSCECHGRQAGDKDPGIYTRVGTEEESKRSKTKNGGAGEKTSLPKRGLLALKYEILRCKETGCNSKEAESSSSVCDGNHRVCDCFKCPPEKENKRACKAARGSLRKTDNCCADEEKKCSRKAYLCEQNRLRRSEVYKSKNDPRERKNGNVLREVIASDGEEMYPNGKPKRKRCGRRKNKLTNTQTGRSLPDDSSDESELEVRKHGIRKERAMKTNLRSSIEQLVDDNTNLFSGPVPDQLSAEVIKIGNRYYQAVRHRTAHVNIMSFKNLKDHEETRRRRKGKKSPRIEVRLKYDTSSSEQDSSEAPPPSNGPVGDAPSHQSKLRKDRIRRTVRDETDKKAVEPDANEAKQVPKKRHRLPASAAVTDVQCGNSPTPTVRRKHIEERVADRKNSSRESIACDNVERVPKAMTDLPSEKSESPRGWKSEGSQRRGVSARTLELKQMSERWFVDDTKQRLSNVIEVAGYGDNLGSCDVRPFTASSSAS